MAKVALIVAIVLTIIACILSNAFAFEMKTVVIHRQHGTEVCYVTINGDKEDWNCI